MFVRGNDEFATKVPLGDYRVLGARGPVWYGEPHYFGIKTRFFKLTHEGGEISRFYREGNTLFGRTWRFIKQQDGNMSDPAISKEEFENN
jgi:hypothetical protein